VNNLDATLLKKVQEDFETIQLCAEAAHEADTDEELMKLFVRSMSLVADIHGILSKTLTDKELETIKEDAGEEWDMWKKANTADGAIALFNYYADKKENE
jgi:lipoate-protein ligase A